MTSPAERGAVGTAGVPGGPAMSIAEPFAGGPAVERMPVGRRLNPRERVRLVREIVISYGEARKALRRMPIKTAVQAMRGDTRVDATRGSERELLAEAWRLGRAVQLMLRLLPGDTRCLTRSLVLTQLLARRGIAATLVIGARVEAGFSAHAWVELAGEPVLPPGEHSSGRLVEL